MGFRDATGDEVEFVVPDEPPRDADAGPRRARAPATRSRQAELNGRGFVDVTLRGRRAACGSTRRSITDARRRVHDHRRPAARVTLDPTQRPMLIDAATHTYRYFVLSTARLGRRSRRSCRSATMTRHPAGSLTSTTTGDSVGRRGHADVRGAPRHDVDRRPARADAEPDGRRVDARRERLHDHRRRRARRRRSDGPRTPTRIPGTYISATT